MAAGPESGEARPRPRRGAARASAIVAAVALAACGGDAGVGPERVEVPDLGLAGAWAGTWTGVDPALGTVTGEWEAEVAQFGPQLVGTLVLSGDADCRVALLTGGAGDDNVVRGRADRPPCAHNEWVMTALGVADRSVGGLWTQPEASGQGTFTGVQVGKVGGPRVRSFSPPNAPPGAVVTVTGSGFDAAVEPVLVDVGGAPVVPAPGARAGVLTFRVPPSLAPGPVHVTAAGATARSPRALETRVTAPSPITTATLALGGADPRAVAFGPDGRRAYVADSAGYVSTIDTRLLRVLASTWVAGAHAVAVSPDGRDVYVASGYEVRVVDPGTGQAPWDGVLTADVSGSWTNSGGIAVTPDGRMIVATAARADGPISLVDVEARALAATVPTPEGATPGAVAVSPDGTRAYVTVVHPQRWGESGWEEPGELRVVDLVDPAVIATVAVGLRPVHVAVTPDGRKVYVANERSQQATVIDTATLRSRPVAPGAGQVRVAVTPDGRRAWFLGTSPSRIAIVDTETDAIVETVPVSPAVSDATALAFSPDGTFAYLTRGAPGSSPTLVELGGPTSLTVAKTGGGIGTVVSSSGEIECGSRCVARFEPDTVVTLAATPDGSSYFGAWSDECPGGVVRLSSSKTCTVTFHRYASGGGGGGGGDGGGGYGGSYGSVPPDGFACFVATAAYGSPFAAEVQTLRAFRDRRLRTNAPGRAFVRAYEAVSPPLAAFIRDRPALRAAARGALWPLVQAVKHPDAALGLVGVTLAAALGIRVARRRGRTP